MKETEPRAWNLQILESADQLQPLEELQRVIWPGSETEVVPLHLLVTIAQNGGLVIAAYPKGQKATAETDLNPPVGFVYSFPGLYFTPDGPRPKHCSHQLGVRAEYREKGLGFSLKRAQWQMVRRQGIDLITWTYDPLMSLNAHLNIARLGAVVRTYKKEIYGELKDDLNRGLPADRFQIDWWINSRRVDRRLSKRARPPLDLAHFLSAEAEIINPTKIDRRGLPIPSSTQSLQTINATASEDAIILVEIPSDFPALKQVDLQLALDWRIHAREIFENLFSKGYWVTDFVYLSGQTPRSFYVLSHGESTL
jgi:predicted GNAT superfamily acetyltransferase